MQIENQFQVSASPETVYGFLLDINRVVGCMPGAELSEVVDPTTFKGKVKIKVGPITVAYNGTAKIVEKDEAARTAKLEASGRETTGPGSANATALMTVAEDGAGSMVKLVTDFTVAGRVANFGRGVMEDVSRRLVSQMADCIKSNLESAQPAASPASEDAPLQAPPAARGEGVLQTPVQAKPVNALSLFFQVLWDRIRRLFGGKPA